jgi:hypothetical protein
MPGFFAPPISPFKFSSSCVPDTEAQRMWKDPRSHFDTSAFAVILPLQISSAGFMSSDGFQAGCPADLQVRGDLAKSHAMIRSHADPLAPSNARDLTPPDPKPRSGKSSRRERWMLAPDGVRAEGKDAIRGKRHK